MKEIDLQSATNLKIKGRTLIKGSIDSKVPRAKNRVNLSFAVPNLITKTKCC